MSKNALNRITLISGILCIILAVIMFIFADGLRRWYSGIFFAIMGGVMFANIAHWPRPPSE